MKHSVMLLTLISDRQLLLLGACDEESCEVVLRLSADALIFAVTSQ